MRWWRKGENLSGALFIGYWILWLVAFAIWDDLVPKSIGSITLIGIGGLALYFIVNLVVDRYKRTGE